MYILLFSSTLLKLLHNDKLSFIETADPSKIHILMLGRRIIDASPDHINSHSQVSGPGPKGHLVLKRLSTDTFFTVIEKTCLNRNAAG